MTASRITEQKIRSIDITTREAYLEIDLLKKGVSVHHRSSGEYHDQNRTGVKYRQESVIERILVPSAEPLMLEIQSFLDCIDGHNEPLVTAQDGLNALQLAFTVRDLAAQPDLTGAALQRN